MRKILIIGIMLSGMIHQMSGQNMHVSRYTEANGLPSNEVRHVVRDSLGFVWVATDSGLVRFDGVNFKDYSQYIPSQYGKYFAAVDQGLLLSHDAGISLIQPGLDTTRISLFQKASINPNDNGLYYPNRIFQRSNGALLVGQPGGKIHKISSGDLKLIIPGISDKSKRGLEFFFSEVGNQVWVAQSDGSLHLYDEQARSLKLMTSFPEIHDMKSNGNELWIAGDKVYRIELSPEGKRIRGKESFQSIPGEVTALALDSKNNIYLGIKELGLYYLDRTHGEIPEFIKVFSNNDPHSLNELPFKNIHNIVLDSDDKLWICSSEGLGILQKRFFESIGSIPNANTTAISIADNGKIFVNFGDLYRIEKTDYGYNGEQLPTSSLGTITALTTKGNRLWTGTSTGKLFELNQQGKQLREINLEQRGEGIFYLAGDSNNRLWVAQAPRDQPIVGIGCIFPNGTFKEYGLEQGLENRIICLRETENGRIYASGIGKDTYLYRYFPEKDNFINLSIRPDFYTSPIFQVHDFTVDDNGIIWLASTDGLLRHDLERISKVDLGPEYSNLELKAVTHSVDGSIWVSFDTEGVLRYKEGNTIVMQKESGLPSRVMTYRCLQSDKEGRLWVGTAEGVVHSLNSTPQPGKSNKPWFISTLLDGQIIKTENYQISPDQEFKINYIAPSFHGFRTFYQHRLNDSPWSSPSVKGTLSLKGLQPDNYSLAVRAKKEGAFLWSDAQEMQLIVKDYWFKRKELVWLIILLLTAAIALVFWSQKRKVTNIMITLSKGLEAKKDEVIQQEADLVKVREEIRMKHRERKANLLALEIMHRLLIKIRPDTKWDMVLETISLDLLKLPGVIAFEIGVQRGRNIEFEGYSEKVKGFTSAKTPFDPGSSLAAYCISGAKAFIFNRLGEESNVLLDKKDSRIEGYKAAISVPFYINNKNAILTIYANKEDLFDQYTLKTIQIFASYLEQII
ncbi:two-component regulator propeller domain-containing protein [uncultured Eudoraea sp.]|uniref:ligand-binding sensor domain-containing protein n=1 Tax=uncultured Eudoraea sp. TaxID=1035614 RepID=UPI002608D97D|nr:two-component regulator propeller domain-containing protein [uncultured Eudoraea sp.]